MCLRVIKLEDADRKLASYDKHLLHALNSQINTYMGIISDIIYYCILYLVNP